MFDSIVVKHYKVKSLELKLDAILAILIHIGGNQMLDLGPMTDAVHSALATQAEAVAKIQSLIAELAAVPSEQPVIDELTAKLKAATDSLAASMPKPAPAPEPAPAPAPDHPAA